MGPALRAESIFVKEVSCGLNRVSYHKDHMIHDHVVRLSRGAMTLSRSLDVIEDGRVPHRTNARTKPS